MIGFPGIDRHNATKCKACIVLHLDKLKEAGCTAEKVRVSVNHTLYHIITCLPFFKMAPKIFELRCLLHPSPFRCQHPQVLDARCKHVSNPE